MSSSIRPAEHLLLASLGRASGTVLGTLDWLNAQASQAEKITNVGSGTSQDKPLQDKPPPVTHLWLVTTQDEVAERTLRENIVPPLNEPPPGSGLEGIRRRFLSVSGVTDITTETDHKAMAEVLYRLVLQGVAWRRARPERFLTVSLTGGRKTMSAVLQHAATFFPVDWVMHLVFDDREHRANSWAEVQQLRHLHYPVSISSTPTLWHELLAHAWERHHQIGLLPENFPLSDGWREDKDSAELVAVQRTGDSNLRLADLIQGAAAHTHQFAVQGLAYGVGPSFVRHDLRQLAREIGYQLKDVANAVESHHQLPGTLPKLIEPVQQQVKALQKYLSGLSKILEVNDSPVPSAKTPVSQLVVLLSQAWILAIGTPDAPEQVDGGWRWSRESFSMTFSYGEELNQEQLEIDSRALLIVLRNLVANANKHGGGQTRVLTVDLTADSTNQGEPAREMRCLRLTCKNPVSHDRVAALQKKATPNGELLQLLQPFQQAVSGPTARNSGDGLGLFTVARVISASGSHVKLIGPRLDPWHLENGQQIHFAIALEFSGSSHE